MAEEQNVYITGHGLEKWSTEATQKQIQISLGLIQADNNAMLRYLAAVANGEKNTAKILTAAVNAIHETTTNDRTDSQKKQQQGDKIIQGQTKIASSNLATVSAITGVGSILMDNDKRADRRQKITQQLLDQGFDEVSSAEGAKNAERMDYLKRLGKIVATLAVSVKTIADIATGAVEQGFTERYAMVAEMRQAGLLAGMKDTEAGFIEMAKTINSSNFSFGEATQFTKQFAKTVGVLGVESVLKFSNSVAAADPRDLGINLNFMQKYGLEFGQVANIAGEYLDTLRIGGQLRTIDEGKLRAGMGEFMSNVEMTANVLKISIEDAANLMQKALGPDSVALLATLPKEQRDAIEEGFLAVNAQGNPMAETLAKRLAAGSRGAFLQTAEFQQMAGTSVGREVLEFVEQMATQLETGSNEDFQSALAQGFPAFADKLSEMAAQGGVRIQLLNDSQLASMVGSIIEAAQTYGDADKGVTAGVQAKENQAVIQSMIQLREAAVLNETAFNGHMERFINNIEELTRQNRKFSEAAALFVADYVGVIGFLGEISTGWEKIKSMTWETLFKAATSRSYDKESVKDVMMQISNQAGIGSSPINIFEQGAKGLTEGDKYIDVNLESQINSFKNLQKSNLSDAAKLNTSKGFQIQLMELAEQMQIMAGIGKQEGLMDKDTMKIWKINFENIQNYAKQLDAFTKELKPLTTQ